MPVLLLTTKPMHLHLQFFSPFYPIFPVPRPPLQVKNIGICVFNSNWIKTCFGKPALDALRKEAVICSGTYIRLFFRSNLHCNLLHS